ncbi:MAG: hypothetical protein ACHQNA_02835 [Acidimicrobiales bacterium]
MPEDYDEEFATLLERLVTEVDELHFGSLTAIEGCLEPVWPTGYGWVICWQMPYALSADHLELLDNTNPADQGWNAIYVADAHLVGDAVVDVADQGRMCIVFDLETYS